jgi:ERCC4-related helicase
MSKIRNILKVLDSESIEITLENLNELYEECEEKKFSARYILFSNKEFLKIAIEIYYLENINFDY